MKEFPYINHQWKIVHCHDSRRVDQKSTTWPRLRWYGSNGHPAFSCSAYPRAHGWAGGSRKLLGGILINSLEAWPMKSRWFPNVSGMAYIISQVYLHYISYIHHTLYHVYIYIHHIHHMAILHQLGWQEFINQFLNMFAHVLKLSNHEYMDGGIALPTLSQANSRNIQSSHIVRFTWKISSNHHKSSPMILKIGSQISNRYPTDIQSSSDRGRLPLPLRHRALWQGALGTGADGPGGGAPGHARQVPWLQWRRQKPWGKIDGELVENRDKSMETWKKMTDRRKNHVKLTEKGHSGFNCYLWMMFSCWK